MKIVQLRKIKNITQAELAKSCATTQQQIAKIEGGIVDPRLSTLRRIAAALDSELPSLFYTRAEFLSEVQAVISTRQLNLAKVKLTELNALCASERGLPAFHPFWEDIQILKDRVVYKKEQK